jgi:hypothetical protein
MTSKKGFPLRLDPDLHEALRRWAEAEFRSMNAQIEFLLREAVEKKGISVKKGRPKAPPS